MSSFDNFFARLYRSFRNANTIGKTAVIDPSAELSGTVAGNQSVIAANCKIANSVLNGFISIGPHSYVDDCRFNGTVTTGEHCRLSEVEVYGHLTMGRYSSLWGPSLSIHSTAGSPVQIGSFCSIGRGTTFQTFGHNQKKLSTYFMGKNFFGERSADEKVSKGAAIVQNDVWIGAQSVILGGITISHGAVVAANSVVNADVLPYAIVAGSPARVVGFRFPDEIIEQLLSLEWWNWPEQKIRRNKQLFEGDLNPDQLKSIND